MRTWAASMACACEPSVCATHAHRQCLHAHNISLRHLCPQAVLACSKLHAGVLNAALALWYLSFRVVWCACVCMRVSMCACARIGQVLLCNKCCLPPLHSIHPSTSPPHILPCRPHA